MTMDRMPNPKKPFIELTPRIQLAAAVVILAGSALLGSMVARTETPRQAEFERNFDAPIVVVPAAPAPQTAPASIELDAPPAPEPVPSGLPSGSAI